MTSSTNIHYSLLIEIFRLSGTVEAMAPSAVAFVFLQNLLDGEKEMLKMDILCD